MLRDQDILSDLRKREVTHKVLLWPSGLRRYDVTVYQKRSKAARKAQHQCAVCMSKHDCCREHQFMLSECGKGVYVAAVQLCCGYEPYEG